MRMNKCAYLFAAALVASTVGMTSCSNEDVAGIENIQGQETKVSMALSVAPSTRATADEVNLGEKKAISNVAVVPMVGSAPQTPVLWDNIANTGSSDVKTVDLLSSVNGFKVYGNLETTVQYAAIKQAKPNDMKLTDEMFALKSDGAPMINTVQCYKPHTQLYYYRNVKAGEFWTANNGASWAEASDWSKAQNIGSAKYVKVDNINYAVGVLAAAVMNGDGENKCFYSSEEDANGEGTSAMTAATAGVTVSAVLVEGQKDFTVDFATTGAAKTIYVAADKSGAFSSTKINSTSDAAANGNVFSVVSPTANGEAVNVNIEFNLPAGAFLKTTTGKVIGSADNATKFYLGLKMTKDEKHTNEVFAADFVTILNATVKNWGIASETPVEVTDAQIGVVFDVEWEEGNIYEVEI